RAPQLAGDRAHRLEVALARDREPRLDHVDAEALELARERELLGEVHAAPGRLLAVAQRGVEDPDRLGRHGVILARARPAPARGPPPAAGGWCAATATRPAPRARSPGRPRRA